MPSRRLTSIFLRTAGTALVAGILLLPRALQAEEVSDEERLGEYDEDGERFGSIVVKGELVASSSAPGGWTLLRTYENKGEEKARVVVEERVTRTVSEMGTRVSPAPEAVLVRTQVLELAAHEKKSIGTYLPAGLAEQVGAGRRREALLIARLENGGMWTPGEITTSFAVDYLRPLAKGEVAARAQRRFNGPVAPPDVGGGDVPLDDIAARPTPRKPTVRTVYDTP
ncbi:MAG: hypothetical protein KIT84_21575 [Labilithrix sp.]|nr:hypothetical protein [Labilithrix sp.]MCW5813635.1 hypothetical protein [Labilithrix sp.]